MAAFELTSHHGRATWAHVLILFATLILLLAPPARAVAVGRCYADTYCQGAVASSISGALKPNDEYKIGSTCTAFLSFVGQPDKVDVCTATACSRLNKFQCYVDASGFQSVEVLEPGVGLEREE